MMIRVHRLFLFHSLFLLGLGCTHLKAACLLWLCASHTFIHVHILLAYRDGRLTNLFNKLDTQQTGSLTLSAFFSGMEMLKEHLSDEELELVGSSVDGSGRITLEQFL